jgi:uncharacterized protein YgiM (DUF1202 family)
MDMFNSRGIHNYRIVSAILILAFILSAAFSVSSAAGTETGKIVNCESFINVRSGPGSSYAKLGTAAKGSVYTVTGRSGSWYQIDYNGRTGYVYSGYISITSQTAPQENTVPDLSARSSTVQAQSTSEADPGQGILKSARLPKARCTR